MCPGRTLVSTMDHQGFFGIFLSSGQQCADTAMVMSLLDDSDNVMLNGPLPSLGGNRDTKKELDSLLSMSTLCLGCSRT